MGSHQVVEVDLKQGMVEIVVLLTTLQQKRKMVDNQVVQQQVELVEAMDMRL